MCYGHLLRRIVIFDISLRWKVDYYALENYKEPKPSEYSHMSWCQLCKKLHTDNSTQEMNVSFWSEQKNCVSPKTKLISKFIKGEQIPITIKQYFIDNDATQSNKKLGNIHKHYRNLTDNILLDTI